MTAATDFSRDLQHQIDEIVASVRRAHVDASTRSVIVDIPYTIDRDWSGDDAIHLTVILQDPPSEDALDFARMNAIRDDIYNRVRDTGTERIPYVSFRLESEHKAIQNGEYDDE